ncbi:mannosyltransferase [Recurvomyces mirabilis]|nr:mannosyltransferase [Recurvomyces mirabilis]
MSSVGGSNARQRAGPSTSASKPVARPASKPQPSAHLSYSTWSAFGLLLTFHGLGVLYSPIQDCDEVFNYWEPTHYLTHGHGFQTWEYSPDYAIRSWVYVGLHALVMLPIKLLGANKRAQFIFLRYILAVICAACETRLYAKVTTTLNPRVANFFLMILATSPGMFHASISYLPSSFAMYFTCLGVAAFMDWRGGLRTAQGIWMFGIGAVLGWPFAAALSIPFLLEEAFLATISDKAGEIELFWRIIDGVTRTLITLVLQMAIDAFFYKKFVVVPLNIVLYNIFSKAGGPDLYGTEPWHFYLRNLFMNFHVWFVLALLALPLQIIQHSFHTKGATRTSYLRGLTFLTPFYLWLAIFTIQPHKEERFMYPAYPALALNAAMSLHIILANLGSTDSRDLVARIPVQIRFFGILTFVFSALAISALRTAGTMTAYGAPLSIYDSLRTANLTKPGDFICLGKEWYRFPSHYLLPSGTRAKFIKSEFSGLLPGEFSEIPGSQGFGVFPGTWLVPPGMNDGNKEDMTKYTDIKRCDFLVDSHLPSTEVTSLEPSYVRDEKTWEKVACEPFLDAASTGVLGRLLWTPDLPFVPKQFRRVWGEYCLLKRTTRPLVEKRAGVMDGTAQQGVENML